MFNSFYFVFNELPSKAHGGVKKAFLDILDDDRDTSTASTPPLAEWRYYG